MRKWKPTVIAVTGSSGKTTLLHLIECQLGRKARYSHHANSAIGIPFDVLDLKRATLTPDEWIRLFFLAPFQALRKPPKEALYVAETDCDRPGEGRFLSSFLTPDVTIWLNSSRTHSMNFEGLVKTNRFPSVEDAIGYEFGYFIERTKSLAIVNADQPQVKNQIPRTGAEVVMLSKVLGPEKYMPALRDTRFIIGNAGITVPALVPEDTWYAVSACLSLMRFLKLAPDLSFTGFTAPPGRSTVLKGKKGVTIIDSSYNANLSSMSQVLSMFTKIPAKEKWLVLSDMLEQGGLEREEHERLAEIIAKTPAERVILMGPRTRKYTYPVLKPLLPSRIPLLVFDAPKEVLSYLSVNLVGRETVLFKGGRFLEGVIEHLLSDPEDAKLLCRREKIWQQRRKQWGL